MKKTFFIILLLINITALSYSQTEINTSIGFGNDFAFDILSIDSSSYGSIRTTPGLIFNFSFFINESKVGFLFESFMPASPQAIVLYKNGAQEAINFTPDGIHLELAFGALFRNYFNDKIVFTYGIRLNSLLIRVNNFYKYIPSLNETLSFSVINLDLGIGGDAVIGFLLTDMIKLNLGIVYSFDFFRYMGLNSSNIKWPFSEGMAEDFFQFRIKPYITVSLYYLDRKP